MDVRYDTIFEIGMKLVETTEGKDSLSYRMGVLLLNVANESERDVKFPRSVVDACFDLVVAWEATVALDQEVAG